MMLAYAWSMRAINLVSFHSKEKNLTRIRQCIMIYEFENLMDIIGVWGAGAHVRIQSQDIAFLHSLANYLLWHIMMQVFPVSACIQGKVIREQINEREPNATASCVQGNRFIFFVHP